MLNYGDKIDEGENIMFALGRVADKYDLDYEQCGILQDAVLG